MICSPPYLYEFNRWPVLTYSSFKLTPWLGENDGLLNHVYLDDVTLRGFISDTKSHDLSGNTVILVPFLQEGDHFFLLLLICSLLLLVWVVYKDLCSQQDLL